MDSRIAYQRDLLEGLLESLDATLRIARWPERESVPPPLKVSAAHLVERLSVANRLANDSIAGAPAAKRIMVAIGSAIRFLDETYVAYRQSLSGSPLERTEGADRLEAGIARVRGDSGLWS